MRLKYVAERTLLSKSPALCWVPRMDIVLAPDLVTRCRVLSNQKHPPCHMLLTYAKATEVDAALN